LFPILKRDEINRMAGKAKNHAQNVTKTSNIKDVQYYPTEVLIDVP